MKEICPICQNENQCGMNHQSDACWCTKATFPSKDKVKLDLPRVCICPNCAETIGATIKKNNVNYPQHDNFMHRQWITMWNNCFHHFILTNFVEKHLHVCIACVYVDKLVDG